MRTTTQRRINVATIHQDHAAPAHRDDLLPTQPHAARILGGESQFLGEFLDRAPAAELTRAIRAVERTRALLRLRCDRLRDAIHAHTANNSSSDFPSTRARRLRSSASSSREP